MRSLFENLRTVVPAATATTKYKLFCLLFSVLYFLTGCAGQLAYRDGKNLIQEEKIEAGLAKFQEALKHDPQNAQYRQAYLQTQERFIYRHLHQADQYVADGKLEQAKANYQRVLSLAPDNDQALAGLAAIVSAERQTKLLNEADALVTKKNFASARKKLTEVLIVNPDNARALALQQTLDEQTARLSTEAQFNAALKKLITLEFKDVALKHVFDVIARSSGFNFLFDKEVKTDQKISIFLKNSTIESAIHFALMTNQLNKQALDHNTLLIYPNTPAKQKEYQNLVMRTFFLTNTEAKTIAATLKIMLKTNDIVVDDKLNMLIMRDSPEAIQLAEKLVALQDVAEPEVMLEVEVIEVQRSLLQSLGIQWPASLALTPQPLASLQSNSSSITSGTSGAPGLTLNDLLHQNKYTLGASVGPITGNANTQDSNVKLLTNPRIRVKNHEKAKILIGERVPNITSTATATGFVSESINYIDIGLNLTVEPTIYLDDNVGIKLSLEVSSILSQITTQSGTSAYQIGTRTASTVLRLKNGETDILAGLIDNQERSSGNKLPGIGDMPILGRLFGSTTDNNQNTEIVLSITPHLIRNIQRPSASDAYFLSGTQSGMVIHLDHDGKTDHASPNVTPVTPLQSAMPPQFPAITPPENNRVIPSPAINANVNAVPPPAKPE
jgi:general secretion pathway protein D